MELPRARAVPPEPARSCVAASTMKLGIERAVSSVTSGILRAAACRRAWSTEDCASPGSIAGASHHPHGTEAPARTLRSDREGAFLPLDFTRAAWKGVEVQHS